MTGSGSGKLKRPAVFLDRDGVIVKYKRLLTRTEDLILLPGAVEGLKKLRDAGYALVLITNQSVVARGMITEKELQELLDHFQQMLSEAGAPLDKMYYCPHHPQADVPEYRVVCECRKPRTLLIRKAVEDLDLDLSKSFFIGDEERDMEAGKNAGLTTILITQSPSSVRANFAVHDFDEAAEIILSS